MSRYPAFSYVNNPEFKRLIEGIIDADCITLLCGAGVAIDAGLPSWEMLIESIAERDPKPKKWTKLLLKDSTDLARKAGILLRSLGKDGSIIPDYGIVSASLYENYEGNQRPRLATEIARLAIATPKRLAIMTTNYDSVIEDALQFIGFRIVEPSALNKDLENDEWWKAFEAPDPKVFHVKHLHGYMGGEDYLPPFILTEDQYFEHGFKVRENIVKAFSESTVVILVGVSLTDPSIIGALAERKDNNNVFILSVPEHNAVGSPADSIALHTAKEDYLKKLFKISVVRLNSYTEVAQLFQELTAALSNPDMYSSDDAEQSIRYGFRFYRALNRAYEVLGIGDNSIPTSLEDQEAQMKKASDKLHELIEPIRESLLSLILAPAYDVPSEFQSVLDEKHQSLQRYVADEGFAIFLWLPSRISLDDRSDRKYALSLVGSSAYSHRHFWSFQRPPVTISGESDSSIANAAFRGQAKIEPAVSEVGPAVWQTNAYIPLTLIDPISSLGIASGVAVIASNRPHVKGEMSALTLIDGSLRVDFLQKAHDMIQSHLI